MKKETKKAAVKKATVKAGTVKKENAVKAKTAKQENAVEKKAAVKKEDKKEEEVKKEEKKTNAAGIAAVMTKEDYQKQAAEWAACNGAKTDCNYELWFLYQQITLSVDDSRPVLKNCYSNGEKMIATNGKILAIMDTTLPRGFYQPAVIGKGKKGIHNFTPVYEAGRYPDVFAVIPKESEKSMKIDVDFTVEKSMYAELFALQFLLATAGGACCLLDQMLDLVAATCQKFECTFIDNCTPVVFKNDNITIVAMPARTPEDSKILQAIRNYRDQIRAAMKEGKKPEQLEA